MIFDSVWFSLKTILNPRQMWRGFSVFICWQISMTVHAQQPSINAKHFALEPNTCMSQEQDAPCPFTLSARWELNQKADVCLVLGDEQLSCWSQQKSNYFQRQTLLTKTSELRLVNQATGEVIHRELVTILYSNPKRFRRRLRSQWSLF
ncbi:DUF3019 domain-containing protein [Thalassotalea euphylliae]|uniref:DUF3019 domain-containing protein n=1 Tax=Thalassotalea euphylliae TaxID=1655234 RepID=UPI0036285FC4